MRIGDIVTGRNFDNTGEDNQLAVVVRIFGPQEIATVDFIDRHGQLSSMNFYMRQLTVVEPVYTKWMYHKELFRVHFEDVAFVFHTEESMIDSYRAHADYHANENVIFRFLRYSQFGWEEYTPDAGR